MLRAAGAQSSGAHPGAGGERERERSRSGGVALKSTGSRHRVARSASMARAASRQCASCQLQPAAAPDLGRYLRRLKQLGSCQSLSQSFQSLPREQTATFPGTVGLVSARSIVLYWRCNLYAINNSSRLQYSANTVRTYKNQLYCWVLAADAYNAYTQY